MASTGGWWCNFLLLKLFKQRLADTFIQEWSGVIRDRDRYEIYRFFKTLFERERYISSIDIYCLRVAVAQAIFGVLPLNNLHRYSVSPIDRNCAFCVSRIEYVYHFMFVCPAYADLRIFFTQDSSIMSVRSALEPRTVSLCRNVSKFVLHAVKRRKRFLDSVWWNGWLLADLHGVDLCVNMPLPLFFSFCLDIDLWPMYS